MILPSQPPTEVIRAYQDGMSDFAASPGALLNVLLQPNTAHEVHFLSLDKVISLDPLPNQLADLVTSLGWRFFASAAGSSAASHVGSSNPTIASPRVLGFSTDPVIERVFYVLQQLSGLEDVQKEDFSLYALRVAWLKFEAFWLEGESGSDLVIPYGGFPETVGLDAFTVYSAQKFLTSVQPYARWASGQRLRSQAQRLRRSADRHQVVRNPGAETPELLEATAQILIDINGAGPEQLIKVLGLTKNDAESIAKYKDKTRLGSFEDFSKVKNFDPAKLRKHRHQIGFNHAPKAVRRGR